MAKPGVPTPRTAQVALQALEAAILQHGLGHNGITLAADDGTLFGDSERCVEVAPNIVMMRSSYLEE